MQRQSTALAAILAAIGIIACSPQTKTVEKPTTAKPVITQFYSSTPGIPKGETGRLCYGVSDAVSVSLDPPVEALKPSYTRCFEVHPERTTKYTLTAHGRSGETVQKSVEIAVVGSAPKLIDASVNTDNVRAGETVFVCWKAQNATKVQAGPGKYQKGGLPAADCVIDQPARTTVYKIVVSNDYGLQDSAAVTVRVR